MKFISIASLAMASLAVGQSLGNLPSCWLPCLNDAVKQSTSCSPTDVVCICKKFDVIQGAAAGCILKACGQDVALNKVLPAAQKLCENTGSGSNSEKLGPSPTQTQTGTVLPLPPQETTPEPTQEPNNGALTTQQPTSTRAPTSPHVVTAGAVAFTPMGGLAMLAMGVLAV